MKWMTRLFTLMFTVIALMQYNVNIAIVVSAHKNYESIKIYYFEADSHTIFYKN